MKTTYIIFLLTLLVFSCKDNAGNIGRGCINTIRNSQSDHLIPVEKIEKVNKLFLDNHIKNNNLRYTYFYSDSIYTDAATHTKILYSSVYCQPYIDNVPVYNNDISFTFSNNVLTEQYGTLKTKVTGINASVGTTTLRAMFLNDVQNDKQLNIKYLDSCLVAEYCYFNLNPGDPLSPLIKSWRVSEKTLSGPNPVGYYSAADGHKLAYWNGLIVIF